MYIFKECAVIDQHFYGVMTKDIKSHTHMHTHTNKLF